MSSGQTKTYRIYFFNAQNRITDTAVLDCSDDQVCIEQALALLNEHRDYRAVEIWQENRKVGLYDRPSGTTDGGSPPPGSGSGT